MTINKSAIFMKLFPFDTQKIDGLFDYIFLSLKTLKVELVEATVFGTPA